MKNLIECVKIRARLSGRQLLSFDELAKFPAEQVKELEDKGVLFQIKDADGIICTECDEHCWKPVETRLKDGEAIGVIYCEDADCGGLIPVELERLQQWEIVKEKLKKKKAKRKLKTPKTKVPTTFKRWDKDGKAYFVIHNKAIKFYYNRELKEIPFQEGSQAPRVLLAFLDNTRSGEEIKGLADAEGAPYQTVRNINRTINTHLRKMGFKDINGIGFIHLDKGTNRYVLTPNIVEYPIFKIGLAALK